MLKRLGAFFGNFDHVHPVDLFARDAVCSTALRKFNVR